MSSREQERKITMVIVDDDDLVGAALALLFDTAGARVVARTCNPRNGLELIEAIRPLVTLIDIAMPPLDGLDLLTHIRQKQVPTRVILLGDSRDRELMRQAWRLGANAYLLRDSSPDEVRPALRAAVDGKVYMTPDILRFMGDETRLPEPQLTLRHRAVLQLVSEGKTNKEMASLLDLSVKTVEKHRAEVMRRLRLQNTADLVRYALRQGINSDIKGVHSLE